MAPGIEEGGTGVGVAKKERNNTTHDRRFKKKKQSFGIHSEEKGEPCREGANETRLTRGRGVTVTKKKNCGGGVDGGN